MKKTSIFWILGGAAALYFLSKLTFSKKINFSLRGLKPSGSIFAPKVAVLIGVQNPTNQRATLKSLSGSISVNGKYLANLSSFGDQIIQPNAESLITLEAKPSVLGVFSSIKELLNTPSGQSEANFDGSANVDGINYPINETKIF